MAKQDDYVRYTIRLPASLYEQVRKAAGDKSVNAEIIARLHATFEPESMLGLGPSLRDFREEELKRLNRTLMDLSKKIDQLAKKP